MAILRLAAVVLVVLGVLGLIYGGFTYVSDTHTAEVGSLSLSVDEKKQVNVPVWAGVGAIVIGGVLFLLAGAGTGRRTK